MKNRSLFLDVIIALCSLIGLILNFNLFKTPIGLLYYTIFSNLICFIFYSISIIKKILPNYSVTKTYIKFKGLVLVSLICTFMIYNFFMVPTGQVFAYDGHFIVSCFVHIFTPILVVADCIINGKNKMLEYNDLFLYFITMIIYGLIILIYQLSGGLFPGGLKYPYLNFDYETYGYLKCIIMDIIIISFYEIIGLCIILINRKVIKKN